ncbi:MAG: metal ABC transporter ATP-binding protein [Candidatus Kapabacteria bacterium]|nr:metal ABC transporter ATP-binding protein [Candidatus Kapabacteria bacterium]
MSINANILEVSNLKVVLGQNTVLEDINFKLPSGSYLAIVGPNGSGKTTLMKTLIGLVKPATGNVKMFGADIDDLPPGTISYVPQIKTMDKSFPARAIDLVMSGIKRRWSFKINSHDSDRVAAIMHEVGAGDFIYRPLAALSGGELQRVFLARSLIRNPKILLLDEPATGIDLVCELSINKLITEYNQKFGTTVIMITHDWSAAYHHTNYVLLLNRRQVYFGESKTAFTDENLQLTFSHLGHGHGIKFGLKL